MQQAKTVTDFLNTMERKYTGDRIVILLFARYGISSVDELLDGSFDYLDQNSGSDVDIFMPGYGKYKYHSDDMKKNEEPVKLPNNKLGWTFSVKEFIEFKKTVMKASGWRYRDHMQLMIFNFRFGKISFENYIDIDVEKAIEKGYVTTAREVFENVIFQCQNGVKDIVELSDKLGIEYGQSALQDFIFSKLPLGEIARRLTPFATKKR